MQIVKANLNHLEAFEQYVEKCAHAEMEMYDAAQSDSEALLKNELDMRKAKVCLKVGRRLRHTSVSRKG